MGEIAIVTDGSLIQGRDKVADAIVPFRVVADGREVIGQELRQEDFLELQAISRGLPTTSAPNIVDFERVYESLYEQGYTDFLVLTVPESYSSTFANAKAAFAKFAQDHSGVNIRVIDTGTTVAGVKYLAEEAVKLRDRGEFFEHIARRIEYLRGKVEIFVTLDTMRYISASGRVAELTRPRLSETAKKYARGLVAKLVALANHSPKVIISIKDGKESILAFSTNFEFAVGRMADMIESREFAREIRRCYLYQSEAKLASQRVPHRLNYDRSEKAFEVVEIVEETEIPLALLAFTGPKLVAAVCIYD